MRAGDSAESQGAPDRRRSRLDDGALRIDGGVGSTARTCFGGISAVLATIAGAAVLATIADARGVDGIDCEGRG